MCYKKSCSNDLKNEKNNKIYENITVDNKYLSDIKSFKFFLEKNNKESHFIYIDLESKIKMLVYAKALYLNDTSKVFNPDINLREIEISQNQYYDFIEKIKEINIRSWDNKYINFNSKQNIHWSILIEFFENSKIIKEGKDDFPANWNEFIELLNNYVNEKIL